VFAASARRGFVVGQLHRAIMAALRWPQLGRGSVLRLCRGALRWQRVPFTISDPPLAGEFSDSPALLADTLSASAPNVPQARLPPGGVIGPRLSSHNTRTGCLFPGPSEPSPDGLVAHRSYLSVASRPEAAAMCRAFALRRSFVTGLIRSSPLFDNFRLLVVNIDQLGARCSVSSQ
jgi:hypothetical protein